ncbi:MAG: AAA family ATPase [Dehalococcoidia bacterium]
MGTAEEKFLDAIADDEEDDEDVSSCSNRRRKERQRIRRKNEVTIDRFLGNGPRASEVCIEPSYYGELLVWALDRHIRRENWKVVDTLGYRDPEPFYVDVHTDYDKCENLIMLGQLLLEKDEAHFVVTVDALHKYPATVQVQGAAEQKDRIEAFVKGVEDIVERENFYRGKKIEFAGRIRFMNVAEKSWHNIVLDRATKREIKANTIDFLRRAKCGHGFGIPQKRGILLAGEPGTGKTLICKALMSEADGITCIATSAYQLSEDGYISDLYQMAEDLSPCIVFIEDIDLIGLNREEYHYQRGPALLSLLNVLDGVEEKHGIVTVATTNNWEALDRAISHRPSRFDRVIKLSLPSLEERRQLVSLLCQKIPVDVTTQDYISTRAAGCTPAQLQEIVFSLAIEYREESPDGSSLCLNFSRDEIERAISKVNGRNKRRLGFGFENNYVMDTPGLPQVLEEDKC